MSPAKADTQARPSKEQVELIRSAIETSLAGLLTVLFKKETYLEVKLFPSGVDLIMLKQRLAYQMRRLLIFT